MAATVTINENNTSVAGTRTDKTSGTVRFKKADDANVDINNPLVKPSAGNDRSYEKWLRARIGSTGPIGQITNLQLYSSGSLGSGAVVYARTTNPGVYATPVIPANDTAGTDLSTFVTGARKSLGVTNAAPYTGTNVDFGDFAVLWATIDNTIAAPQNPTTTMTVTMSYDET